LKEKILAILLIVTLMAVAFLALTPLIKATTFYTVKIGYYPQDNYQIYVSDNDGVFLGAVPVPPGSYQVPQGDVLEFAAMSGDGWTFHWWWFIGVGGTGGYSYTNPWYLQIENPLLIDGCFIQN
jgi:hypothetical protein